MKLVLTNINVKCCKDSGGRSFNRQNKPSKKDKRHEESIAKLRADSSTVHGL